jgi:hypothetical protein
VELPGNTIYKSQFVSNVLDGTVPGGCSYGFYIEAPGTMLAAATLTISGETFTGLPDNIDLLGAEATKSPNQRYRSQIRVICSIE